MLWLKHISPLRVPPVPHNQVCLRSDIVGWSDPQTERMLHSDHVLIVGSKMLGSLRSVFGPRYDLSWSGGSFPICFRPAKALDKQTSRHARYDIMIHDARLHHSMRLSEQGLETKLGRGWSILLPQVSAACAAQNPKQSIASFCDDP